MTDRYFAHSKPGAPETEWEPLEVHLSKVANLAADFASPFGAAEWARLAGRWHDLGKYSEAFQRYIRDSNAADSHVADKAARVDHSTAGAQHAARTIEILGHLLAYMIAGHHSGLADGRADGPCLEDRLRKQVEPWSAAPAELLGTSTLEPPMWLRRAMDRPDTRANSLAFFVRMVFSCLVDADFLATEEFMSPDRTASRPGVPSDVMAILARRLDDHMTQLRVDKSIVNAQRALVRDACLAAAELATGLFSLTVPTGGGKTLSSLAFALKHAQRHGMGRVIYVVPFTTIIEQNAAVFRRVLFDPADRSLGDPVLEHHSNFEPEAETVRSRLATENWESPVIVTTSVQFYESLFGNRTSRCRRLHNMARAVIVLDEAQAIPVDYLAPCLHALKELSMHYGSTVVLCTATQPAITLRDRFPIGLSGVHEIVPEPAAAFSALRRVEFADLGPTPDAELLDRLRREPRVLCIVNTRSHARKLFEQLGNDDSHFHLSALMCPRHRTEVLQNIRLRLASGSMCRVVATQLVEAGVDIDFPVVFRSLAGIDSIAQAAGRCNRNGRLDSNGRTYIFQSEHVPSERFVAQTADCARLVLPMHDDPLHPETIEHYFNLYYWQQKTRWDSKGIMDEFHLAQDREFPFLFNFARVAESFKLIDDSGRAVIVPWREDGRTLSEELRRRMDTADRFLLRRLQGYSVSVPLRSLQPHFGRSVELVGDRYALLVSTDIHYSERIGLDLEGTQSVPLIA